MVKYTNQKEALYSLERVYNETHAPKGSRMQGIDSLNDIMPKSSEYALFTLYPEGKTLEILQGTGAITNSNSLTQYYTVRNKEVLIVIVIADTKEQLKHYTRTLRAFYEDNKVNIYNYEYKINIPINSLKAFCRRFTNGIQTSS